VRHLGSSLPLERLYLDLRRFAPGTANAYLLAVAVVAFATLLRIALGSSIESAQFIFAHPAVLIVTFVCGMRAGALALVLSALSIWFFFLPPGYAFQIEGTPNLATVLLFLAVGAIEVLIIGALRTAASHIKYMSATSAAIFSSSPDAIVICDPGGIIRHINTRALQLFGFADGTPVGRAIEDLIPERFCAAHVDVRRAFSGKPTMRGMGRGMELFGRRADGSEISVDVQIGPVQIEGQALFIATVRDISEQKALAKALAESQRKQDILAERDRSADELRRWADAFENAAFGIAILDPRSNAIATANAAFARLCASKVESVKGRPIVELFPNGERPAIIAHLAALDHSDQVEFEATLAGEKGAAVSIQMNVTSVHNKAGTIDYRIASIVDISERKRVEDALRHAQKMEAIGNVTGGMAHDFNNLLAVIVGNLDLAESTLKDNPQAVEYTTQALDAALRGAELTRSLLAFARRQTLLPALVQPNEFVASVAKLLERVLGEQISIQLDLAPDLWPVVADPAQLEASLVNLATNARDAMPNGGKLIISTGNRRFDAAYAASQTDLKPGDYAAIEVTDSGAGMTPEIAKHIFEPFYTTKMEGSGTGLGLSMVFGFVKQSGGHVAVYSEPGIGSTFRLFLPRAAADALALPASGREAAAMGNGESVLIVEDNAALRSTLLRQLHELGYRTQDCESADAALTVLNAKTFDLLLTDIVMPGGMNGIELVRSALARWPEMRVLLSSGYPGAKVSDDLASLPKSVGLLTKPYRKEKLAAMVREALETR